MATQNKKYRNRVLNSIFKNYEQPVNATILLFHEVGVPVPGQEVNEFILSHPDYPSLLSISDCLAQWGVENVAVNISPATIDEYPLPMLIHMGGEFRVITGIEAGHITYLDELGSNIKTDRKELLAKWNGVALLAQAENRVGTVNASVPDKRLRTFQVIFSGLLLLGIVASMVSPLPGLVSTLAYSGLIFLKLAGLLVCAALLWYQADKTNPLFKKLCGSNESSGSGCTAVLNAEKAYLVKGLSWSETGFFYFAGGFFVLLALPLYTPLLAWMNVFAIPFIAYSLYYQKFVAARWCPLCLLIQAILLLEFVVSISTGFLAPGMTGWNAMAIFQVVALFAFPVMGWYLVKPFVLSSKENKLKGYELARIKHHPVVFKALLDQQKQIALPAEGLGIVLGNREANNSIIKVCNPYCAPCGKAHGELDGLLEKNKDVNVRVIFTATNKSGDERTPPARHLLAIAEKGDEAQTHKALDDWYLAEKKDYPLFADKYRMNGELKKQDKKIEEMDNWCRATGVSFTPTIFVNGRQLPEMYAVDDLKYVLTG